MSNDPDDILKLKYRLAQGVSQHQRWSKDHEGLHEAAKNGQKPAMVIYHNGTVDPAALFDLPPAQAFCAGEFPLILRDPDEVGDKSSLYPFLAAATYASKILGVEKQVMVLTDKGPLRTYLHQREMGPLMAPWAGIWHEIVDEADAFAAQAGITDQSEIHRRAALILLSRNAKIMEQFVGKQVICCYLDTEKGVLEVHPPGNLADMWHNGSETRVGDLGLYKERPRALACSCCDSRAGHGHMYCAQPGEFLDSNVIAAIVPPYREIIENKIPHSVWALAEHAYACGVREAVVTGHSQCGGIQALVNWRARNQPPGKYLDAWIGQAVGVVDEVIAYAQKQGFLLNAVGDVRDEVYRLTEMRVTQWSARNLEQYFKDRAEEQGEAYRQGSILAHYLKIEEREVYVLNPYDGIEKTYQGIASLETLEASLSHLVSADGTPFQLWKTGRYRKAGQLI